MSRTYRGKDRRIRIRSERKHPVDVRKLGAAIIALAQAKLEKESEADHKKRLAPQKNQTQKRRAAGA